MKLMFLHPVDYGRKAEELLWRKVYYEVIQVIKTNKKVTGPAAVGENPLCTPVLSVLNWLPIHQLLYDIYHFEVTGTQQIFLNEMKPLQMSLLPLNSAIGPTIIALIKCSLIISELN